VCLHTANEPNVHYRVLAHGKEDTRRQTVLLGWGSGYWMESLPCWDTGHTAYYKLSGTRQTGCSRHTAHASIVGRWHTANVGTRRRWTAHGEPRADTRHRHRPRQTAAGGHASFLVATAGRLSLYFTVGWLRAHGENFAVGFSICARHRSLAVARVAVWCSPWANTRRKVCRAFSLFCREPQTHGIDRFSGSVSTYIHY
jgi:hypothetical protein